MTRHRAAFPMPEVENVELRRNTVTGRTGPPEPAALPRLWQDCDLHGGGSAGVRADRMAALLRHSDDALHTGRAVEPAVRRPALSHRARRMRRIRLPKWPLVTKPKAPIHPQGGCPMARMNELATRAPARRRWIGLA